MKLRIEKHLLEDAADAVSKALPNRPSVPVLAGVKIVAADGGVVFSGFDHEVSTEVTCTAEVGADGSALVSGRLLAAIAKALPNKPVDIAAVGAHLEVVCGSARFTLPTMPVEDYPNLPVMPAEVGTVDAAVFAAAVAQVAVAAGRDDTLPMMTGVRVEINGGTLAMLATDRYRLAVAELDWAPNAADHTSNMLVPARILHDTTKALGPLGGTITLALSGGVGEGMVGLSTSGRRVTSRLLDGANYPPVRSLFPKPEDVKSTAVVPVAALSEVVKRVALVAERTTPVLLSFSTDGLVVEAGGTEEARASEAMDATFTGDSLTVGFNPQYLIDGLAHLGAQHAHFAFVDPFKPAVICPVQPDGTVIPGYRYLIMPIRVSR